MANFLLKKIKMNKVKVGQLWLGVNTKTVKKVVSVEKDGTVWFETVNSGGWLEYLGNFQDEHTLIITREVTLKEQDLIFIMFICEFMEWTTSEYVMNLYFQESSLAKKVYDALKCE